LKGSGATVVQVAAGPGRQLAVAFKTVEKTGRFLLAAGFCGPSVAAPAAVERAQGAAEWDPARWTGSPCSLVAADGRISAVRYTPFDAGRATFASASGWPWSRSVSATRGGARADKARVRITKLGGGRGLDATEYFYVHGATAANVVLFNRMGEQAGLNQPAALICGYAGIVRQRKSQ
jgi:hypothetical protein